MKIVLKILIVYFFVVIFNEALIKFSINEIAIPIDILSYSFLIIWLFKKMVKICINNSIFLIRKTTYMLILSCIIFFCSYITETEFVSVFIPNYTNRNLIPIEIINAVIFAPISEEILFRGITLHQFMKNHTFLFANIIQAAVFAILHLDIHTFAFLFLFGIMQGIVCIHFNLYSNILIHSLGNLATIVFTRNNLKLFELQKQEHLIVGVVFLIITTYLLIKIKTNKI